MTPYGTEIDFYAYAAFMGYHVPPGDIRPALARGSVYIDGLYGDRFSGKPAEPDQDRAWPRTGAAAYDQALADDLIPQRVISAAYEAALVELRKPGALSIFLDPSKRVKRQKVDTIEREFFDPGDDLLASATPILTTIGGLLSPLLVQPVPAILVV